MTDDQRCNGGAAATDAAAQRRPFSLDDATVAGAKSTLASAQVELDLSEKLLTVAEAAHFLNLEEKTVRKYIRVGIIGRVQRLVPSNQLRIPEVEVRKLFRPA